MGRHAAAPGRRERRGGRDDEGLGPRGEVCGRHGGTRREECVVSGCGQGEECGGEEGGGEEEGKGRSGVYWPWIRRRMW